jgi:hypothetical protein
LSLEQYFGDAHMGSVLGIAAIGLSGGALSDADMGLSGRCYGNITDTSQNATDSRCSVAVIPLFIAAVSGTKNKLLQRIDENPMEISIPRKRQERVARNSGVPSARGAPPARRSLRQSCYATVART